MFIRYIMGTERYWLFKRQKRRLLSLDHDPLRYRDKNREIVSLLGWKPSDYLDKQLLKGIFSDEKEIKRNKPLVEL